MIRRFLEDRRGAISAMSALALPVAIGAAGLAVDVGHWYGVKRSVQSAADAAAYAGALDLGRQGLDGSPVTASVIAAGEDAAARNGATGGATGAVTVNHPPAAGPFAGDPSAVEVVVAEPAGVFFTRLFLDAAPRVSARAVAKVTVADACIWALHPSERGAVTIAGNADVDLSCGVVVNSDHPQAALNQVGSSCLSASSISVGGGISGDCLTPAPETFTAPPGDPLASLEEPTVGGCDYSGRVSAGLDRSAAAKAVTAAGGNGGGGGGNGGNGGGGGGGGTTVLHPGVYCDGIQITGDAEFEPGEYILNGGSLRIAGQATVTGRTNASGGVTFFLTGQGNDYAQVDIAGGATVSLTPRTVGPRAEVLFMQDRAAPANGTHKFSGGSTMDLQGIIYIPNQAVQFTGGSSADEAEVLIAASTVTFSGNSRLSADYARSLLPQEYYARLVE